MRPGLGRYEQRGRVVSILVLVDGSLRPRHLPRLEEPHRSFNPCFGGWVFETPRRASPCGRTRSFNPCFGGWVFETGTYAMTKGTTGCFNPCFGGWVFETMSCQTTRPMVPVSILVLVDGSLRLRWSCMVCPLHLSFNPCFGGWVFETLPTWFCPCPHGPVSILVLVDGSLRPVPAPGP